jgi:transposase-like protein
MIQEIPQGLKQQAAERAEQIRLGLGQASVLYAQAVAAEDWRILSYASEADWAAGEFGPDRFSVQRRQEIVAMLTSSGYTQRRIAAVTGVDSGTVSRDQAVIRAAQDSATLVPVSARQRAALAREARRRDATPLEQAVQSFVQAHPADHGALAPTMPRTAADFQAAEAAAAGMAQAWDAEHQRALREAEATWAGFDDASDDNLEDDSEGGVRFLAGDDLNEALRDPARVVHRDGNSWNNDPANLEIISPRDNDPANLEIRARPAPLALPRSASRRYDDPDLQAAVRERVQAGQPMTGLAEQFGVSGTTVDRAAIAVRARALGIADADEDDMDVLVDWNGWTTRMVQHVRDANVPAAVLSELIRRLADLARRQS